MSPAAALIFPACLLALPWVLMPRDPAREVRGLETILWWVNRFYCGSWHRLDVRTPDSLPETGPALLICNHTCCVDHLLLQASTRRKLGFLIAKEYFDYWLFRPFCRMTGCIPVRRDGKDLAATRGALRALEDGRVVPIFPEGHIVPTSGREIGEGKPGAAYIALRAKAPVVPAYLCGTPPTNEVVPSLLLPSHVRVYFGPPIDLSDLTGGGGGGGRSERENLPAITERLMGAIHALRDQARAEGVLPDGPPTGSDGKAPSIETPDDDDPHAERPANGAEPLPAQRPAVGRA